MKKIQNNVEKFTKNQLMKRKTRKKNRKWQEKEE